LTFPRHHLADAAVRVLGPRFGLTPDYIAKHLGISFAVDNRRSVDELGLAERGSGTALGGEPARILTRRVRQPNTT
jgi:hypothetical protein